MSEKILVIRLGSLGDVILTSATVLNLKIGFPSSEIVFLTRARYADLVRLFDGVDRVVSIPDKPGMIDYLSTLRQLDNENYDLVIDLHGNFRSWLGRRLISANQSIIYPKRRVERQIIVRKKHRPESWPHTIDLYNNCLTQLGKRTVCWRPLVHTPSSRADDRPGRAKERPVIFFAPGAAHPDKQWGVDRFFEVARELNRSRGARIIWAVTSQDSKESARLSRIPASDFELLVDSPLTDLARIIANADLTIANDSGIMHLSSAVGTPVLGLFGPTHPSLGFAPRGLFDEVLDIDEPCRPCSLHGQKPCYREERFCFTRLAPQTVIEKAKEGLDRSLNLKPALFVDRDGTIIKDKDYLSDPDQVELESGSAEALQLAREIGLKIVVVSNQSGVARGFHDIASVERVNGRMLELLTAAGAEVDAVYYCPHHTRNGVVAEFTRECNCRKPAAGMPEEAALSLGLDLRASIVVGDSLVDYNLGRAIGARSMLVRTGYGAGTEGMLPTTRIETGKTVFDNLMVAVKSISIR